MTNLDSILKSRDITLRTKVHIVNYGFSISHVGTELDRELHHVRVRPQRRLSAKELMLSNCDAGEDS